MPFPATVELCGALVEAQLASLLAKELPLELADTIM